jgi:hypothetical protein
MVAARADAMADVVLCADSTVDAMVVLAGDGRS